MHPALLLLAALQTGAPARTPAPPQDTARLHADSAAIATAFQDDNARRLVRLARGHRGNLDASVFHYSALLKQRISVGVRALRRDRLLYRRETAATVDWWRDRPGRIVVHGAREAVPLAMRGVQVPDDLGDWIEEFVPTPGDDRLLIDPSGEGGFAWHPLVPGGEALYRYATGDTTTIRLPAGREIRLVELRVTPRKPDFRVVTGSFWIELEDHAIVQAVFRPARSFDIERDMVEIEPDDAEDVAEIPGLLKPIEFDVEYMTIDYGLWELRWWMPRLMAFRGMLRIGAIRTPITLEVAYSDYQVEADRYGLPELPPIIREIIGDPRRRRTTYEPSLRLVIPDDTAALLESEYLPGSFFQEGESLIAEEDVRRLGERLGALPPAPWEIGRPTVRLPWPPDPALLRYNRVEGLSAGVRVDWDLERLELDLTGRVGHGDGVPRAELGVDIPRRRLALRGAAYFRRLDAANPAIRPLGVGNSLTSLVFGRDDGVYYEASGAELTLGPPDGPGSWSVRLYGEHQGAVARGTDFSFADLFGEAGFRDNIAARDGDQVGIEARVRAGRGLDPAGVRWSAWLGGRAETGTFDFVRPEAGATLVTPVAGPVLAGLELGAGTTLHREDAPPPPQALWYLGGPASLRGFAGDALSGADFFRGRLELSTAFPGARAAVFSDAGWTGTFDAIDRDAVALAVGVGTSFLDGLVRFDIARTLQPTEQWRADLYLDALF